jgi:hypothetical protein
LTIRCLAPTAFLLFSSSGIALGAPDNDASARITTIVGLNNIQEIGSTQNINDVDGNAIMANPNPYKVVVVPENLRGLARGTVLVSNIGNDGTTGTQQHRRSRDPRICPSTVATSWWPTPRAAIAYRC